LIFIQQLYRLIVDLLLFYEEKILEIKVKSKLEEHILTYITPEGDVLDLEGKNITPEHMRLLCQAGETLGKVKELYLSNNGLKSAEIEIFSKSRSLPLHRPLLEQHGHHLPGRGHLLASSKPGTHPV
jgi:hypothetical protein